MIDRKNQEKLYIQIMRAVVDEIGKGVWKVGDRIPSEDDLGLRYGVSKITVRQALGNLAADGYLIKVQGKGTFVASSRPIVGLTMRTLLTSGLFGPEVEGSREVVERGFAELPEAVRGVLGAEGAAYRVATLRRAQGVPVSVDESYLPPGLLPGIETQELGTFALFAAIQERGTRKVFRMRQDVEIATLSEREARLLERSPGEAALAVHRLLISAEDVPLSYSRIVVAGGSYRLETAFERIR